MLATAPVNALAGLSATRTAAVILTHKLPVYGAQNIEVVCAAFPPLSTPGQQERRAGVRVEVIDPNQNVVGHGRGQCNEEALLPDHRRDAAIRPTQVVWASLERVPKEHRSDSEQGASSQLSRLGVATLRFTLDPGVTIYGFAFAD